MNCANERPSFGGKTAQKSHESSGRDCVEPAGGLIEKTHRRVGDELCGDIGALQFSSRNAFFELSASNSRIAAQRNVEAIEQLLCGLLTLLSSPRSR